LSGTGLIGTAANILYESGKIYFTTRSTNRSKQNCKSALGINIHHTGLQDTASVVLSDEILKCSSFLQRLGAP